MLKINSIKQLLQVWSIGTVCVVTLIAIGGIYTNSLFSEMQQELTETVIPIEELNRETRMLATVLAEREKQLLSSNMIELSPTGISRVALEQQFNMHWQHLSVVLENQGGQDSIEPLWQDYQQFLEVDNRFIKQIENHHVMTVAKDRTASKIDEIGNARNQGLTTLFQHIDSSQLKDKDVKNALMVEYKALEFDFLKLDNATLKLKQGKQTNARLTLLKAEIQQTVQHLLSHLAQLTASVSANASALNAIESLIDNVKVLEKETIESAMSLYQIQYRQLNGEIELLIVQSGLIETLNQLIRNLNQLPKLTTQQSLSSIAKSISIAEKTQWALILLALSIALSLIWFIRTISRHVNEPLHELRNAMHALSSHQFDIRLSHDKYNNEFSLLASDFNQFASSNQSLIEDLDKAKQSLQQQKEHLKTILNGVPEAIVTLNADGIIKSVNPHTKEVLQADEGNLLGRNFIEFFDDDEQVDGIADLFEKQKLGSEFSGIDYKRQPFSMWLSLKSILIDGEQCYVSVISDITNWKKTEQKLKRASSELDTILENAMVGIAFIKDRQVVRVNQKFEEIFGYNKDEVIGKKKRQLCPDDATYEMFSTEVYSRLEQSETYEGDIQFIKKTGELFWCRLSCKSVLPGLPAEGTIWIFEDITKQRQNDEKLRNMANLDSLTGLPHRGVFNDRLMHAIHKAQRVKKQLAIFFLDLDHFKNINDSLGHKAGDQLLCEVARRLTSCVRSGDTVARLGGDEFTLILEDVQSVQYVAKIAEKVINSVSQIYTLGTTEVSVSPSIGISLYPSDGRGVDVLLRNADAAMYHAKNNGRNTFQFYSSEMNAKAAHRLAMETALRRAVEQQDFYLHYQPQFDITTNAIIGAEALLRWHSDQWGDVSPMEFIPILEDTGLIGIVGELVLLKACEAYSGLRPKLTADFQMAVNLSGRQFKGDAPLAVYVEKVLEQTGMSAANLELEITETILMHDTDLAIKTLSDLSALGVTLAVDDFGTGYSSLSYLKQFPLNVLKIDKSFIDDVTQEGDDAAIVDAILAMSEHLKLDVVAEGIETSEQLTFLQQRKCSRGQGYLFSRPLSLDAFEAFVDNHQVAADS